MDNKIRIELYNSNYYETWQEFLSHSVNATHFHSLNFLSYHSQDKFNLNHLLFFKKGKLLGVMPSALTTDNSGRNIMLSPYGGSYGGIAHKKDLSFSNSVAMLDSLESFLRENNINSIRITFPPYVYYDHPCWNFDLLLLKRNARLINRDLSQAIDTRHSPSNIFDSCTSQCRNKIRKAEKMGLNVRQSDDINTFYEMLTINKKKHNDNPTHSIDEIVTIRKLNPDWAKIFIAYTNEGTTTGGVLTMCCNKNVLLSFYTCHLDDFKKYSPVNLLNYKIACWAHAEGFRWFDLGTSTVSMEIRHPLIEFKESFGAVSIMRDTYQWDII